VWHIGEALVRLLAPILSFTCEEIWQYLPKIEGREESVHLAGFYGDENIVGILSTDRESNLRGDAQKRDWNELRAVRDEVLKKLEEARNNKLIGTGLEAQVSIAAPDPMHSLLKRHEGELRYLFIVSAVNLTEGSGNGAGGVHVEVRKADGQKCERCWNYSTHVGEDKDNPTVCERCSAVLKEINGA
jgi:isoleucyl-tRNA synthetase